MLKSFNPQRLEELKRIFLPFTTYQTIYNILFALAVRKLRENSIVDLDKDVNEYLNSRQIPKTGDWQPKITMSQLLTNTAGLTIHGFPGYTKNETIPTIPQILNGEEPERNRLAYIKIYPVWVWSLILIETQYFVLGYRYNK